MTTSSIDVLQALNTMSDDDRAFIGRIMRGEADRDQIQRGLVHAAIRSLRTNPVPTLEYQKALFDVQKLVSKINATPQPIISGEDKAPGGSVASAPSGER